MDSVESGGQEKITTEKERYRENYYEELREREIVLAMKRAQALPQILCYLLQDWDVTIDFGCPEQY